MILFVLTCEVLFMPETAQNIKISSRAWELLRWAKFQLNSKSYSEVIIELDKKIQYQPHRLKKSLQNFDEEKHRIKVKTPGDKPVPKDLKPKTILLSQDAHRILERLKVESSEPAYTFSDAIEFLVDANGLLPKRFVNN
jgi:predicted CopG family antitoxin